MLSSAAMVSGHVVSLSLILEHFLNSLTLSEGKLVAVSGIEPLTYGL